MATPSWITEKQAAEKLNKAPEYMRRKIKSGAWPIAYSAPTGRGFFYDENGIQKFLTSNSTIIKSKN